MKPENIPRLVLAVPRPPNTYGGVTPLTGAARPMFWNVSVPPPPIRGVAEAVAGMLNLPKVSDVPGLRTCVTVSEKFVSDPPWRGKASAVLTRRIVPRPAN